MQLQVKLINQHIVHGHSPFYVERHSIPSYTAKTLSRYFSHTFSDPSLAVGASARPARLILYFWRLLALHNPTRPIYMMRMHALLPPLLLQVLCCMLFTGVAKGAMPPC